MSTSPSSSSTNGVKTPLIYELKLSSVVPASITPEENGRHDLTNMDLIMKLHYITTVHFFDSKAAEGLGIGELKKAMFKWLEVYYPICGRIRIEQSDGEEEEDVNNGRPYLKCNDSGVRVVEAKCMNTLEEFLQVENGDHHELLVYNQRLSADLQFTPLVFLQLTNFKSGGLCVGMSWAHILGDMFSASECITTWARILTDDNIQHPRTNPVFNTKTPTAKLHPSSKTKISKSIKPLHPPEDNWSINNTCKMRKHSFQVPKKLLNKIYNNTMTKKPFEAISAVIWKSLAKVRKNDHSELNIITLCRRAGFEKDEALLGNGNLKIGVVEVSMSVVEADLVELVKLMNEKFEDETEKMIVSSLENVDFMVYGANLTFVNLEGVDLYGMEVKGCKPVFADLSIGGVGDNGVVLVFPMNNGFINVNVILPEVELHDLKNELKVDLGIF